MITDQGGGGSLVDGRLRPAPDAGGHASRLEKLEIPPKFSENFAEITTLGRNSNFGDTFTRSLCEYSAFPQVLILNIILQQAQNDGFREFLCEIFIVEEFG